MSSANVTIVKSITKDNGSKQANAAFHGDERMLNVLLRTLVAQDRYISSQINLGGVVTGVVAAGQTSATIVLGFQPAYVKAIAYTGTVLTQVAEAFSGMAQSMALVMRVNASNAASALIVTTGGFVLTTTGFKGGTNVFTSGKRVNYVAMRRIGV